MTINITSPVTGTAQTGLTSPTYTLASDIAPTPNGKQQIVSALGGTQTGVAVHSVALPFSVSVFKPQVLKTLGQPNVNTGTISNIGKNSYKIITRKGVVSLVGQAPQICVITTEISVPAGADTNDLASIRAALSLHIGSLSQQSAGIGDTAGTGTI